MTQAEIARALMIYTWDGYDPNEINGRINPRDFDDACEVCHTMGATAHKLTNDNHPDSSNVVEYLFPDGSVTTVIVDADGVGVGIDDILP